MDVNHKPSSLGISNKESRSLSIPAVLTPPDEDSLSINWQTQNRSQCQGIPRKEEQTDAQSSYDSLGLIFRHTPVPVIVLDASLLVIEVSNSHLSLLRRSRASLLGASIYEIPHEAVPSPDIASLRNALELAVITRTVQFIENISVTETRSEFSLQITPVFQGHCLINVTLELRNLIEGPPRSSQDVHFEQPYYVLIDAVKDYSILMLDVHGNIAASNSGASAINRYSSSELIGKHISNLLRQRRPPCWQRRRAACGMYA
jgi:osomolarity two-component system sensor histidine kinase TcsA